MLSTYEGLVATCNPVSGNCEFPEPHEVPCPGRYGLCVRTPTRAWCEDSPCAHLNNCIDMEPDYCHNDTEVTYFDGCCYQTNALSETPEFDCMVAVTCRWPIVRYERCPDGTYCLDVYYGGGAICRDES